MSIYGTKKDVKPVYHLPEIGEDGVVGGSIYDKKRKYADTVISGTEPQMPDYSVEKSHDGEIIYCNGRLMTVHEAPLQFGLLGYTNTVSDIFLTTKKDFDIPREKVFTHEKLHCSLPDASEEEIRYKTDVEFRPSKGLASVSFSFYSEPIYVK